MHCENTANLNDEIEPAPKAMVDEAPKTAASSTIDLYLWWPGDYWSDGFKKLRLELRNNGRAVDAKYVYSGFKRHQNKNFIHPSKDWAGSGNPIHEGVFSIGGVDRRNQNAPGVGPVWIPVWIQQKFSSNNRSAFGFHDDHNRATSPGSAGCIVTKSPADLEYIIAWLEAQSKPSELVVDWKTGFLEERDYRHPNDPDRTEVKPEPVVRPTLTSAKGIELIKHFEGKKLSAYLDPVGIPTIGYGHTKTARMGQVISSERAEELLRQDLATFENGIRHAVSVKMSQPQFDALVSWAFNVGLGAARSSTLLRKLNAGSYNGAAEEFKRWNKGTINGRLVVLPGLTRRRKAEELMFRTGKVDYFV